LALGALEDLAHAVIDDGANGLVALGTTAEAATLTTAERRAVLGTCARACRSRGVTLIAGAGSNDTASTLASLRDLAQWPEVAAGGQGGRAQRPVGPGAQGGGGPAAPR